MTREQRGSARQRGYDARWDKAAATFKLRNPHCLGCKAIGITNATEVVDHVEPHKGDQRRFWDTRRWQPACRHHHDVIKPRLERMFEDGEIGADDLWLNSEVAMRLSRQRRPQVRIGADGWPEQARGGGSKV